MSLIIPKPVAASIDPIAYGVKITIDDGTTEMIYFADHDDDLEEGNWIELSGGSDVTIPTIEATYDGFEDTTFDVDTKTVTIDTSYTGGDKTVTYPLETHPVYVDGDDVTVDFWGQEDLKDFVGDVNYVLIEATVTEWKDAYTDLITEADTTAIKDLIDGGVASTAINFDVNGDGDETIIFEDVPAGDYILALIYEDDGVPYILIIFSATPVEVLDYDMDVDFDDSITKGDDLDIDLTMDSAVDGDYIYGAIMIRSSVYELAVKLTTDSSLENTNVTVNDVVVAEGEGTIADDPTIDLAVDIDNLNTDDLSDLLVDIFGENYMSVGFEEDDEAGGSVSLTTDGMHTGEYILLMGVWDSSNGNKLVAFAQDTVTLNAESGGGGGEEIPTVEEVEDMTLADAVETLINLDPEDAAALIDELPLTNSTAIIEAMAPATAAEILLEADPEVAANILDGMPPADTAAIVQSIIDSGHLSDFVQVLIDMEDPIAADVLYALGPNYSAALIEAMASRDLTDAAYTAEDYVKLLRKELDAAKKLPIMQHIREAFRLIDLIHRVHLLIAIADLPQTPSTVATIFEICDFAEVMDDVTGMGEAGAWAELGKVFDYLTTETLGKIYTAMTEEQRAAISPYLTAATVARLPKLYTFTTSDLTVTPASVKVGESVTVTVKVTNTGSAAGSYDVVLKVNSVAKETKTVSLNAGASTNVSFTVTESTAGTYSVSVGSLSGSFAVKTPAAFAVSNLQISATEVDAGADVTVTVTIGNTGDLSGSYELSVKLDGVEKYSDDVTVDGKSSVTKTYKLSSSVAGQHTVTVDGLSVQFTVKSVVVPPTTPDYTWYIVGGVVVIIAAIAVYFLFIKKKTP